MHILVLGSAAGGGFPQWNCACSGCAAFWRGEEGVTARTQSSIAVSANGKDWAVFNASPDLRQQIIDNKAMHPRVENGLRDSPIKSAVLTNGDLDHVAGLLSLREKHPLALFATPGIHEVLEANPVFAALDPEFVSRRKIALETSFQPVDGVIVRLFPVPGKVPLYMEGDTVDTQMVGEQTVGAEIEAGGKRVLYIPGCAAVPDDLKGRMDDCDLLLFDGTLWVDDEMQREGVGQKTGARMGHMSISGPEGTIAALDDVDLNRRVFVHMNNTNPVIRPGTPERAELEASGWEIADDGMMIKV